jgi:hypothetical protein
MPKDAPPNGATPERPEAGSFQRVSGMQTKLHCWAAGDPGRRFDDLFNLVCDPATLMMAFVRVAGNQGAMTAGVDGWTVATFRGTTSRVGWGTTSRVGLGGTDHGMVSPPLSRVVRSLSR